MILYLGIMGMEPVLTAKTVPDSGTRRGWKTGCNFPGFSAVTLISHKALNQIAISLTALSSFFPATYRYPSQISAPWISTNSRRARQFPPQPDIRFPPSCHMYPPGNSRTELEHGGNDRTARKWGGNWRRNRGGLITGSGRKISLGSKKTTIPRLSRVKDHRKLENVCTAPVEHYLKIVKSSSGAEFKGGYILWLVLKNIYLGWVDRPCTALFAPHEKWPDNSAPLWRFDFIFL